MFLLLLLLKLCSCRHVVVVSVSQRRSHHFPEKLSGFLENRTDCEERNASRGEAVKVKYRKDCWPIIPSVDVAFDLPFDHDHDHLQAAMTIAAWIVLSHVMLSMS